MNGVLQVPDGWDELRVAIEAIDSRELTLEQAIEFAEIGFAMEAETLNGHDDGRSEAELAANAAAWAARIRHVREAR